MRAVFALFIVLAVTLASMPANAAGPGAEVKSSPLFKRSLEESIVSLETKAAPDEYAPRADDTLPTSAGCDTEPEPLIPTAGGSTCAATCSLTECNPNTCLNTCGSTCSATCFGTCSGPTCTSTCLSTCSGPTCGSTCEATCDQVCPWVEGDVMYNGDRWYQWWSWAQRKVSLHNGIGQKIRETPYDEYGSYAMQSITPYGWLKSYALYSGTVASGTSYKPSQSGSGTIWVWIDAHNNPE